jgi:hypothetical protein
MNRQPLAVDQLVVTTLNELLSFFPRFFPGLLIEIRSVET